MRPLPTCIAGSLVAAALALGSGGCIKSMLLKGQLKSTREAGAAIDTLHDYEVARGIAFAGLGQFEGMHKLAPDNEDGLYLLAKGWAGATYAFIEDDYEVAMDADDEALSDYHKARARAGYERAVHYGTELLEKRAQGLDKAKQNVETMKAWLQNFEGPDDAAALLWTGYAWLAKTNMAKDEPAVVGELYIGVSMIERSVEIDETAFYASGHVAMGAYHARTAMAELDDAWKHLQRAIQLTGGKSLMPKFQLAKGYYCNKGDKANYEKTLNEILAAGDILPEQRLQNTIAKRRAKRFLSKSRMAACGF